MYSKILQLRVRGVRRLDRDVNNDSGTFGMVEMVHVGGYLRMTVREHGNNLPDSVRLPALWEAKCLGWIGNGMSWQGYQQHQLPERKGNPVYLQEWRVEVIGERPPVDRINSVLSTYNQYSAERPAGAGQAQPEPEQSR